MLQFPPTFNEISLELLASLVKKKNLVAFQKLHHSSFSKLINLSKSVLRVIKNSHMHLNLRRVSSLIDQLSLQH